MKTRCDVTKTRETKASKCLVRGSKIRVSGPVIEYRQYEHMNNEMPIRKLDDEHYLVIKTGEIKEYSKNENRSENLYSLANSMSNARAIINANFDGGINQAWLTLTYRENMQDTKKLYIDFHNYIRSLRIVARREIEYMAIAEPQKRGAWHLHVLLKASDGNSLFIPHATLLELWGHGGVNIKRLQGCDNIGAYISAYCSNLPSEELDTKKYEKGKRLALYPPGMNFYRCSRGMIRPKWREPTIKEKREVAEMGTPDYSKTIEIYDDDLQRLQTVFYQQFNSLRKK